MTSFGFIEYLSVANAVAAVRSGPKLYNNTRLRVERKVSLNRTIYANPMLPSGGSPVFNAHNHGAMPPYQHGYPTSMPPVMPPVYAPYPYYPTFDPSQFNMVNMAAAQTSIVAPAPQYPVRPAHASYTWPPQSNGANLQQSTLPISAEDTQ